MPGPIPFPLRPRGKIWQGRPKPTLGTLSACWSCSGSVDVPKSGLCNCGRSDWPAYSFFIALLDSAFSIFFLK